MNTCEGDDNRIVPANDFIASDNPVMTSVEEIPRYPQQKAHVGGDFPTSTEAEILIKAHKLNLEAFGSKNQLKDWSFPQKW